MKLFEKILVKSCEGDYHAIAGVLSDHLEKIGAEVIIQQYDDHGIVKKNVIGIFGSPELLINCHMDTVPPGEGWDTNPYELVEKDGKLYGLGTCDTKGNIYALLKAIERQRPQNLMILFSFDEEVGSLFSGVTLFLESELSNDIKYAIVCEPTGLRFVDRHKGYSSFRIKVRTKAGHSSIKSENAIAKAAPFIIDLDRAGFNVSNISGGRQGNIIADLCEFKASYRGYDNAGELLDRIVGAHSGKIEVQPGFNGKAFVNETGILDLSDGEEVGFWTEAALFQERGIDSLVFGAGHIEQAHSDNEFVEISQIEGAMALFVDIFERYGEIE
ncbi:MAG: M20/M25/M40 family metallo-hydrolase [candidate division KSB1 bacterium]|jgi:acetylornithine deacetylase|nr:M20/M25/M40 family metallo-hydrolase [candidate division KSB1 bacterium]